MDSTCKAPARTGEPCRAPAGPSGFCAFHDPAHAAERAADKRKGGRMRAASIARAALADLEGLPPELKDGDAVRRLLESVITNTLTGKLDCRIAAVVGQLSGVVLKAIDAADFGERLAALESAVAQRRGYP